MTKTFQSLEAAGRGPLASLRRLAFVRALLVGVVLGLTFLLQAQSGGADMEPFARVYRLIALQFALIIGQALVLKGDGPRSPSAFGAVQVALDVAFLTALVFVTGGVSSVYTFFYVFVILGAAISHGRVGAYSCATAASLCIGGLVAGEYWGWAPPRHLVQSDLPGAVVEVLIFTAAAQVAANVVVALLGSYLAGEIRSREQTIRSSDERMRRLRALHSGIVRSIGSGVFTTDSEGHITSVNRAGREITGFGEEALVGERLDAVAPEIYERLLADLEDTADDAPRSETTLVRGDGEERFIGYSVSPLDVEEGDEVGHVVVFRDLTEIKELERAYAQGERLRLLGEMAAAMAHEIRNPLASMSGCVEMLKANPEIAGRGGRLLDIVLRESDRLNGLIGDFLAYARPDRIRPEPVCLSDTISVVVHAIRESGSIPEGVALDTEVAPNLWLNGDGERLRQVLWNVVNNAVHAVGDKGGVVVRARSEADERARVEVEDDGPGMGEAVAERVFEPFFTTKEQGTGLGLALAHRIVEAHGGTAEVVSAPGVGTRFSFTFPMIEAPAQAAPFEGARVA